MQNDEKYLTPEEIEKLRGILKQDERVAWLWATVRIWAAWVLAVMGGIIAFRNDIRDLFSWITGR